jgi:hypothetical protein
VVILLRIMKGKSDATDVPGKVKAALKEAKAELETGTKDIMR